MDIDDLDTVYPSPLCGCDLLNDTPCHPTHLSALIVIDQVL